MGQTIKEIKATLAKLTDLSAKEFLEYEADERAGVQAALKSRKKQILAVWNKCWNLRKNFTVKKFN